MSYYTEHRQTCHIIMADCVWRNVQRGVKVGKKNNTGSKSAYHLTDLLNVALYWTSSANLSQYNGNLNVVKCTEVRWTCSFSAVLMLMTPLSFAPKFPWYCFLHRSGHNLNFTIYSETCEIRTPLGRAKNVPNSEVSSFQGAICTENSSLRRPYFTCPHFAGLLFTGFTVIMIQLLIISHAAVFATVSCTLLAEKHTFHWSKL
jgi:hypothetical protein